VRTVGELRPGQGDQRIVLKKAQRGLGGIEVPGRVVGPPQHVVPNARRVAEELPKRHRWELTRPLGHALPNSGVQVELPFSDHLRGDHTGHGFADAAEAKHRLPSSSVARFPVAHSERFIKISLTLYHDGHGSADCLILPHVPLREVPNGGRDGVGGYRALGESGRATKRYDQPKEVAKPRAGAISGHAMIIAASARVLRIASPEVCFAELKMMRGLGETRAECQSHDSPSLGHFGRVTGHASRGDKPRPPPSLEAWGPA